MEQPIITEGNTACGMVQNTSQDNAMEQPIVTEGNTAYGIVGSRAAQSVVQQQQNNEKSAAGETFYEAIPTGNATTEEPMYDYPKFSPEENCHDDPHQPPAAHKLPSAQQANVTTIPA